MSYVMACLGAALVLLLGGCTTKSAPDESVGQAQQALTAPTTVSSFVLLATKSVTIADGSVVSGGNIGVGPGGTLTGAQDTIGVGQSILAPTITLSNHSVVGNLFATTVNAPSSTFASLSPYAAPPVSPPIVAFTAGTAPVVVNAGQTSTLAPGNYSGVIVNGTLNLSGGLYQISSLTLGNSATVTAQAASILRIAGTLTGADRAHIAPAAGLGAGALRIATSGAVSFGNDGALTALLVSSAGFTAGDRFTGSGSIAATTIALGHQNTITFATGFGCDTNSACNDANPCTPGVCADAECTNPPAPNGTVCSLANASATCVAGACTLGTCTAGFGNCDGNGANGCETNLNTTTADCGACGHVCTFANAGASCAAGACVLGACTAGFGNCDGNAGNGCETNLNTTTADCGSCGNACTFANAGASCAAGACVLGACNAGFGDCDGNAANGCETNLNTNPADCGACGNPCVLANATAVCASAVCAVGACNPGFGDCDGNPANGCETALDTNTNCGACGLSCSLANATASCASGTCAVVSCNPGFADCDGNPSNGCEAPLNTNANCGKCGTVCTLANATASCSTGTCAVSTCNAGFGDCDGVASDGCEASLQTDPRNCGACGVAAGGTCSTGQPGFCATGTSVCQNGGLVCQTSVAPSDCLPPTVTILSIATENVTLNVSSPPTPLTVNLAQITVTGTVSETDVTVSANGVPGTLSGSTFTVFLTLQEGPNNVIVSATNSVTGGTGTAAVPVTLDTTKPRVTIDTPGAGAVVSTTVSSITVSGSVLDQVLGTVNDGNMTVTVNGQTATVSNNAYQATGVALAPGTGTITVLATDTVGNIGSAVLTINRDPSLKAAVSVQSGDAQPPQTAGTQLSQPLTAIITDNTGSPVVGAPVAFTITHGNGSLSSTLVCTGADGTAATTLTLGTHAGAASDVVQATSPSSATACSSPGGYPGVATFSESANANKAGPRVLAVTGGANQSMAVGASAPVPFQILLTDVLGNPLDGQSVTFSVIKGNGVVNGGGTAFVTTDTSGRASATFAAGLTSAGFNSQVVQATAAGAENAPAPPPVFFVGSTLSPNETATTTVSGVALTNWNAPIANVIVSIRNTTFSTTTDADGRFTIPPAGSPPGTSAPSGPITMDIDGTATGYSLVSLEFTLTANSDNPLDRPIYLPLNDVSLPPPGSPPVDQASFGMANPTTDIVLTRADTPGLSLTIPAGSATFINPTSNTGTVHLLRVNRDKIPMTPPNGTLPSIAFAIMPRDVRFNPPAPITFPNVEGRAPGEIVTIFSYDHDLGEFVAVGTATISADGRQVVSMPGQGIIKGGWHVVPPVAPTGGLPSFDCVSSSCVSYVCKSTDTTACDVCGSGIAVANGSVAACTNDPDIPAGTPGIGSCNASPTLTVLPQNPDIECYNCATTPTGSSCTSGVTTCGSGTPMPPGTPCTRGADNRAGFSAYNGQPGQCTNDPLSAGSVPVCCPTANICASTSPTGQAVCCANLGSCHPGNPPTCSP